MPALKWHEWVLRARGTFHHEGLEINVTTALISFSESLFCPIPPSCSLRTLWHCIDWRRKWLFLGITRALLLEGGWEPRTTCAPPSLEMPWQGSCLHCPRKRNWNPIMLSSSDAKVKMRCSGFIGRQIYLSQPLALFTCLACPGVNTYLYC